MPTPSPAVAVMQDDAHPRLNRRQAAKIRTRQKVLDAARALFAERGYEPATIRDIAKGAGMSTGAVFANFQDKAELFEAVLAEDMARITDVVKSGAEAEARSVRDRLVTALTAGYKSSMDQLPLVQAVVARSWFQPLAAEMRARHAVRGLGLIVNDILQDGVRQNQIRADADLALISEIVWNAYMANYRRAAYDAWTVEDLSKHLAAQIDVILAGALKA